MTPPPPTPEPQAVRFVRPGLDPRAAPLVLLHGTGGHEDDLLPVALEVAPQASIIGLRGSVSFQRGYAFFERRPDRRVNELDLQARVPAVSGAI